MQALMSQPTAAGQGNLMATVRDAKPPGDESVNGGRSSPAGQGKPSSAASKGISILSGAPGSGDESAESKRNLASGGTAATLVNNISNAPLGGSTPVAAAAPAGAGAMSASTTGRAPMWPGGPQGGGPGMMMRQMSGLGMAGLPAGVDFSNLGPLGSGGLSNGTGAVEVGTSGGSSAGVAGSNGMVGGPLGMLQHQGSMNTMQLQGMQGFQGLQGMQAIQGIQGIQGMQGAGMDGRGMLLPPGLFRQNSLEFVAPQGQVGETVRQGSFNWSAVAVRPELLRSDTELSFNMVW